MSVKIASSTTRRKISSDSADGRLKNLHLSIKLTDTGEVFQLKNTNSTMTIKDLKSYLEFVTGIPVFLQRLHYLDETELQEHTDIKSNDIVSGGQLHMSIWHTWVKLINAVIKNNISEVMKLGVTPDSTFNSPSSAYMNAKNRQNWLAERAFVALFVASHRGHQKLVDALVSSGAAVNMKTKYGRTPLHVAAAQGKGAIVDVLLNNGADVNEVDEFGDTALAIAERFGHKDGARHLFLFRWQVRAAAAEKVPEMPMYFHQQCDTTNPVWLSGTQGQLYYASKDKFVDEFAGTGLQAAKATNRAAAVPLDERVQKRISHTNWLSEKEREEEIQLAIVRASKAAKKLEEEKRREQNLIDKESYETWVKKQQEQKEKQQLQKKLAQANKLKQQAANKNSSVKGSNSVLASDNFDTQSEREADTNLSELLAHMKTNAVTASTTLSGTNSTTTLSQQPQRYYVTSDGLLFENEHETIDRVKNTQLKRAAADKRNISLLPNF